jgi:LEA14-like dessication related protein
MNILKLTKITFLLGILLTAGCVSLLKKTFKKPKVSYEAMKIESIDPAGASIRLFLGIDNENNMDLHIDHMDHIIYLEGNKILETTITDKVYIKPKDKTIIEFPLQLSFSGLKGNLLSIWNKKKIEYQVDSKVFIKSALGVVPFNLKYDEVLELPPLPDLSIEKIKIDNMSFSEIDIIVSVLIENNDKIKLDMKELDYEIYFNTMEIAKGKMDSPKKSIHVKNKENKILLEIPVKMKLLGLKRSITDMFKKGEIDYKILINIKGNSAYGEYNLPLDKSGLTKIY